jgi:hypothetical protein
MTPRGRLGAILSHAGPSSRCQKPPLLALGALPGCLVQLVRIDDFTQLISVGKSVLRSEFDSRSLVVSEGGRGVARKAITSVRLRVRDRLGVF